MSYDAIIFDFDGVLISGRRTPRGVYERATREVLRAFGRPDIDSWPIDLQKPSTATEFRTICSKFDLPPEPAWTYREAAATTIEHEWIGGPDRQRFPDVDVLQTLAETYPIAIASNNRNALVGHCIDRFGWEDMIAAYRGRYPTLEEYDQRKPNPCLIQWVVDDLSIETPLYVGDRETDVMAADRIGCDSVLLRRREYDSPDDSNSTFEITSLTELPKIAGMTG